MNTKKVWSCELTAMYTNIYTQKWKRKTYIYRSVCLFIPVYTSNPKEFMVKYDQHVLHAWQTA